MRAVCRRATRAEWNFLEKTVDRQLSVLARRGCPWRWIRCLELAARRALPLVAERYRSNIDLPLLAVLPVTCVNLKKQLAMVRIGGRRAFTLMNPRRVCDLCITPRYPYWLLAIDAGAGSCGYSVDVAIVKSQLELRRPLTAAEVLALCIHDRSECVVSDFAVWAGGSFHEVLAQAPGIFWDEETGSPCLGHTKCDVRASDWGMPTADEELMIEGQLDQSVCIWTNADFNR